MSRAALFFFSPPPLQFRETACHFLWQFFFVHVREHLRVCASKYYDLIYAKQKWMHMLAHTRSLAARRQLIWSSGLLAVGEEGFALRWVAPLILTP